MKKTLLSVSLMAAIGAFAQTTVTFEDLDLDTNSYWDGSDSSGFFISGGITFPNQYNFQWDYWSGGFIYSNTTNVTTPGSSNDFSAFTGGGADGSAIYSVNYGGNIDFGSEKVVSSIAITNTTYAALSMMNGDNFGKKFGSPNNAQGSPDGTNGEDFFRLLITGYDGNNDSIGTVTFYLADFRFADSTQDYILDTWENVDLTPLGSIRYLDFTLESSDVGQWGMNTPAYFALDNIVYGNLAVEENAALAFEMYPNPATNNITVKGATGLITVTNTSGAIVYQSASSGTTTISCADWANGYYIVSCTNELGISRSVITKQ